MSKQFQTIEAIPALKDNYIWSIQTDEGLIIVDPGDSMPVLHHLNKHNQQCIAILITHHHFDHIGGVDDLYATNPNMKIYGPKDLNIQSPIQPRKNSIMVANINFEVFAVPGHTLDHIAYYDGEHLFIGDTLFSAGCGRIFEGTYKQMLQSLDTINKLPDKTKVFCAHEYTLNNLKFALSVEPDNPHIIDHIKKIEKTSISLPTSLGQERTINPFLRLDQPTIQKRLLKKEPNLKTRLDIFSTLRKMKDDF